MRYQNQSIDNSNAKVKKQGESQCKKITEKRQAGDEKEALAKSYLLEQGLTFIDQNFNCKVGEVDLIFYNSKSKTYIFVEVRYRKNMAFGGAAASITYAKQQKVKKAAIFYLHKRKLDPNIRFDVIAFENNQLNWIESAFS